MASLTARWSLPDNPSSRPRWRSLTPFSCRFLVSRSITSSRMRSNPRTSAWGRAQFSVEKAYRVRYLTPCSANPSMTRRIFSVPARCPANLGKPRCLAQRPFPSIIMATWPGRGVIFNWVSNEVNVLTMQNRLRKEKGKGFRPFPSIIITPLGALPLYLAPIGQPAP